MYTYKIVGLIPTSVLGDREGYKVVIRNVESGEEYTTYGYSFRDTIKPLMNHFGIHKGVEKLVGTSFQSKHSHMPIVFREFLIKTSSGGDRAYRFVYSRVASLLLKDEVPWAVFDPYFEIGGPYQWAFYSAFGNEPWLYDAQGKICAMDPEWLKMFKKVIVRKSLGMAKLLEIEQEKGEPLPKNKSLKLIVGKKKRLIVIYRPDLFSDYSSSRPIGLFSYQSASGPGGRFTLSAPGGWED